MGHKVDRLDREIVALLIEDGRMSCADIARRLGGRITARGVGHRIRRMVESGVLRVSALVNPKAIGFPVCADIWLEIEPGRVLEVAQKMAEFPQVSYVACSTGDRDLSIQVQARDNESLYHFVTEVVGKVPGVRRTSTILVPVIVKDIQDWGIPESAVSEEGV
jgi:Lrp/AsnC family transcriptional regulator for asnA, asnC and gidA